MRVQTFLRKKGIEIERKHSGTRSIMFRKIEVDQPQDRQSCSNNRPFFEASRKGQSDIAQDDEVQLTEVSRYEVEGDYKDKPAEIIDEPIDREQGEM